MQGSNRRRSGERHFVLQRKQERLWHQRPGHVRRQHALLQRVYDIPWLNERLGGVESLQPSCRRGRPPSFVLYHR